MALQAGRLFGNYRVVRLIGEGAFGEVYLAENPHLERRAAIKVLRPLLAQDAELVRRFFNEARAASAIRHPSIIDVFDAGETPEGAPYILMEFLEGASLKKRLKEVGRFSVAQALELASQAGSALAAAHAIGIVHRDLKPENLFLVPDANAPSGERVKILDFGIAKVKHGGGTAESFRTETGLIMGSPTYMSPEQCKDSADVDLRADIYSLATIIYEMMAGRPPYQAATGVELLLMHLTDRPRPLRALVPHVPVHVQAAVMRALHQERSERFDGVPVFLAALTRGPGGGPTETLPGEYALATEPKEVPHIDAEVAVPGPGTFSLANAQVGEDAGTQTVKVRRSWRRSLGFATGGLVVLAFVLLVLFRRGHDSAPPALMRKTIAASPVKVEPVRPAPPENAVPANLASDTLAEKQPTATNAEPQAKDLRKAAWTGDTPKQPPTTPRVRSPNAKRAPLVSRKGAEATPHSARRDQEDIAGF